MAGVNRIYESITIEATLHTIYYSIDSSISEQTGSNFYIEFNYTTLSAIGFFDISGSLSGFGFENIPYTLEIGRAHV